MGKGDFPGGKMQRVRYGGEMDQEGFGEALYPASVELSQRMQFPWLPLKESWSS